MITKVDAKEAGNMMSVLLALAKGGNEVVITENGIPIAHIQTLSPDSDLAQRCLAEEAVAAAKAKSGPPLIEDDFWNSPEAGAGRSK
jgi:antitoxin (DNA-binding transcriptional repressor) of toxin-antitoxin stability system